MYGSHNCILYGWSSRVAGYYYYRDGLLRACSRIHATSLICLQLFVSHSLSLPFPVPPFPICLSFSFYPLSPSLYFSLFLSPSGSLYLCLLPLSRSLLLVLCLSQFPLLFLFASAVLCLWLSDRASDYRSFSLCLPVYLLSLRFFICFSLVRCIVCLLVLNVTQALET